jgi:hypothetical protein
MRGEHVSENGARSNVGSKPSARSATCSPITPPRETPCPESQSQRESRGHLGCTDDGVVILVLLSLARQNSARFQIKPSSSGRGSRPLARHPQLDSL